MHASLTKSPVAGDRHPLLGLRQKPGRLALTVFRMPLRAYRHDAGWMLGRTFLRFTHIGRRTGRPYETAAMVLRYDEGAREAVICAAWGPQTDWLRNLQEGPAIGVDIGRDHFVPEHRFLDVDEAFDVAVTFRREHRHRLCLMQEVLGWGNLSDDAVLREFVARHPMVAFRPRGDG